MHDHFRDDQQREREEEPDLQAEMLQERNFDATECSPSDDRQHRQWQPGNQHEHNDPSSQQFEWRPDQAEA